MAVRIGSARADERGKGHGGAAGDQTGREVSTQSWYLHSKGWRVFRAKDPEAAERIAACMEMACDSKYVGYDQYQRNTLYKCAEPLGFDVSKVVTPCETDCSALVRVCCAYAGIMDIPYTMVTSSEPATLLKTGAFVELKGAKYQEGSAYLGRGDILCTKTSGHTVVVLTNGAKYEGSISATEYDLGDRVLKHGCAGPDVQQLQELLLKLNYDLGKWGADGDYGDCTELAVRQFQNRFNLLIDGEAGPETIDALIEAASTEAQPDGQHVWISGGNCYVRTAPTTDARILGVAINGTTLPWQGQTSEAGWLLVTYNGQNGWVSGKYGRVVL